MKKTVSNCTMLALSGVAAVVVGFGGQMLPAIAGDGPAGKLIDRPFEECLIKHFQTRFFNRIDATADQRKKLSSIFLRRSEETLPLREQLRHGLLELNELMAQDTASDDDIVNKAHEVRAIHQKVMDERLKSVLEVRAVLTPTQRQAISDKISGLITGQWKHRSLGG